MPYCRCPFALRFRCSGSHTVTVELSKLPEHVHRLYMVLSGYTCTLKQILQPFVR